MAVCQIVHCRSGKIARSVVPKICGDLKAGAAVIFPTETVYGLGASAFSPTGIRRIYELKGRSWKKPLALLVTNLDEAAPLVESIPNAARVLARHYCPGPLTLVLTASELGALVTGGLKSIAVRIPDHPVALQLLKACGFPLATTSVNHSGDEPAVTGEETRALFENQVSWIVDGGRCRIQQSSTVIDLTHFPYTIVREGAVSKKTLEKILTTP